MTDIKISGHIATFKDAFRENKFFFLCLTLIVAGMLAGSLAVNLLSGEYLIFIKDWFLSFFKFRSTAGFSRVFFNIFLSGTVYFVLVLLSSLGLTGVITLPVIVFFRGFGTCLLAGFLYREYSLTGIAFADLILLPGVLATDFLLIYICAEAVSVSFSFLDILKDVSSRGIMVRPLMLKFLRKFLIVMLLFCIFSLIEALFSVNFTHYFSFN